MCNNNEKNTNIHSVQGLRKNSIFSVKIVRIYDKNPLLILVIQNELKSKQIEYLQKKIYTMKMLC